ncbi:MAG: rhodanese-like domain-containing protein [Fimbriimonas sp.]|nr:rhodanese-like domain-containing protein [Fimbriimonas sp.]
MLPSLSPVELQAELQGPNPPTVIDVREAHELEIASLKGAIHIPLGQVPEKVGDLNKDGNYVIMCRGGTRSAQAATYMLQQGFTHVRNLTSGINGWARTVDPSMSEY